MNENKYIVEMSEKEYKKCLKVLKETKIPEKVQQEKFTSFCKELLQCFKNKGYNPKGNYINEYNIEIDGKYHEISLDRTTSPGQYGIFYGDVYDYVSSNSNVNDVVDEIVNYINNMKD